MPTSTRIHEGRPSGTTARTVAFTSALAGMCLLSSACGTPPATIVINELTSAVDDQIELFNAADEAVDVSGWSVALQPLEQGGPHYSFLSGTTFAAKEYLVLVKGKNQAFSLSGDGALYLYDDTGLVIDTATYATGQAIPSYCRIPDGDGAFQTCSIATFGVENVSP